MIVVKTNLARDERGGIGLCAAEAIKEGDLVWRYDPETTLRLSLDEYTTLLSGDPKQAEFLQHFAYSSEIVQNGQRVPVVDLDTDTSSFLNHSDTPNLVSSTLLDGKGGHTDTNIALMDIEAGEPFGYDYRGFVLDIASWHRSAKVRTCGSFLLDPKQPSLTYPKSNWRTEASFEAFVAEVLRNVEALRVRSKMRKTHSAA